MNICKFIKMRNLELLDWLTEKEIKTLNQIAAAHKRGGSGIRFAIKKVTDDSVTVLVVQKKNILDDYLDSKQLVKRGISAFDKVDLQGRKLLINAIVYQNEDLSNFDITRIKEKIEALGLQQSQICGALGIDKVTLSNVINGKMTLNKWKKSAFLYYFRWLESQTQTA